MVNRSVPSSVVDILSLVTRSVETMSRATILEVLVGSLEPTLSSGNTRIWELESPLAWKNSEFDAAAAELESTEPHLRFAEDGVSLMLDQVQSQEPQLRKSRNGTCCYLGGTCRCKVQLSVAYCVRIGIAEPSSSANAACWRAWIRSC